MKPLRPLLGRVCALPVFVEGPAGGSAALDETAEIGAWSALAAGLGVLGRLGAGWGAAQSPAVPPPCAFALAPERRVALGLDPRALPARTGDPRRDFGAIDRVWLSAALTATGFPQGGGDPVSDLRQRMRQLTVGLSVVGWAGLALDDVFPVFVTNYPTHHHAYVEWDRFAVVNLQATLAMKPTTLHRVFAHEIGHLFRAPDEYAASSCTVADVTGPFATPNTNCAFLTRTPPVPNPLSRDCLMNHDSEAICPATALYWGWRDADQDGVADLGAPPTVDGLDPQVVTAGEHLTLSGRNVWDVVAVQFTGTATSEVTADIRYLTAGGAVADLEDADPDTDYLQDRIAVVVPASLDGLFQVSVVTRAGGSPPNPPNDGVLVAAAGAPPSVLTEPAVFALSPTSGPVDTEVFVSGANFTDVTEVDVGGEPGFVTSVFSATLLSVLVPSSLPPGSVDVTVTTAAGGTSDTWVFSTFEIT